MYWVWAVTITALLIFCMILCYGIGHRRGYRKGANQVLGLWREHLEDMVESNNNDIL